MRFHQPAHADTAERARQTPGVFVLANVYPARESGEALARRIRTGQGPTAYRPAGEYEAYSAQHDDGTALWVRYVAGLTGVLPMRETITVRVPDYGTQRGYEGVRISTVEISAKCRRCGGPRGPVRAHHFIRDGARFACDRWTNDCSHTDEYSAVLAEARLRVELADAPALRGPVIRGVEGGQYAAAVDFLAAQILVKRWLRAKSAAVLLDENGHTAAAAVVRAFITGNTTGAQASAKSAALYLMSRDERRPAAGTWTDGRVSYEADTLTDPAGGAL